MLLPESAELRQPERVDYFDCIVSATAASLHALRFAHSQYILLQCMWFQNIRAPPPARRALRARFGQVDRVRRNAGAELRLHYTLHTITLFDRTRLTLLNSSKSRQPDTHSRPHALTHSRPHALTHSRARAVQVCVSSVI